MLNSYLPRVKVWASQKSWLSGWWLDRMSLQSRLTTHVKVGKGHKHWFYVKSLQQYQRLASCWLVVKAVNSQPVHRHWDSVRKWWVNELDKSRTMLDEVGPTRFWDNKPLWPITLGNKPLKIFCRKLTPSVWLLIHGLLHKYLQKEGCRLFSVLLWCQSMSQSVRIASGNEVVGRWIIDAFTWLLEWSQVT